MATFDFAAAQQAGYSPEEIAGFLAKEKNFDIPAAQKAGYSQNEILSHLTGGEYKPAQAKPEDIDTRTGAGLKERFIVGSAASPEAKLARARDLWGESARQEPSGNISFINPETGRRSLVNPTEGGFFGFDLGDIAGAGREIGSAIAGLPAFAAGPVAGVVGSSALGAAAGQGIDAYAAMLAREAAEKAGRIPSAMQAPTEALKEAAIETGLGIAGGALIGGAAKALPVAGQFARDVVEPMTKAGQARIAGRKLTEAALRPEEALANLAAPEAAELVAGSAPTVAQASRDRGLAYLEKAMQSTPRGGQIGERYLAQQEARQEAVKEALGAATGTGEQAAGGGIKSAFDEAYGAAKKRVREAYQNIDPENITGFPVKEIMPGLQEGLREFGMFSDLALPGKAKAVLGRLSAAAENNQVLPYRDVQSARHILSDAAQESAKAGNAQEAALAGRLKSSLDQFLENSAGLEPISTRQLAEAEAQRLYGSEIANLGAKAREQIISQIADDLAIKIPREVRGFTPDQAQAFRQAKVMRRQLGEIFEQGANLPMTRRGDAYGGGKLAESATPRNYFTQGGIGGENVEALKRAAPAAVQPLREFAVGQAEKAETSAALQRFLGNNNPALGQLAQKPEVLSAIRQDLTRQRAAERAANVGGSQTARNLAMQARLPTGLPFGLSRISSAINKGLGLVSGDAQEAIERELMEAVLNPQIAQRLLQEELSARAAIQARAPLNELILNTLMPQAGVIAGQSRY